MIGIKYHQTKKSQDNKTTRKVEKYVKLDMQTIYNAIFNFRHQKLACTTKLAKCFLITDDMQMKAPDLNFLPYSLLPRHGEIDEVRDDENHP